MTTSRITRLVTHLGLAAGGVALLGAGTAARADEIHDRDVGIGLSVGEPTGLSAQFDVDRARSAINLAAGLDYAEHRHVHVDYLFYPAVIGLNRSVAMPLYIGLGGFVKDHPDDFGPHGGARMPLGLELDFRAPIQVFGELTPSLTLVETDDQMPHRGLILTGAVGVRARM